MKKREQEAEEQDGGLRITACGLNETYVALRPIVFEECYAIDNDQKFISMVKRSQEITEDRVKESCSGQQPKIETGFVGVHFFVMVHGFQGNHGDMRLFRNQISL